MKKDIETMRQRLDTLVRFSENYDFGESLVCVHSIGGGQECPHISLYGNELATAISVLGPHGWRKKMNCNMTHFDYERRVDGVLVTIRDAEKIKRSKEVTFPVDPLKLSGLHDSPTLNNAS